MRPSRQRSSARIDNNGQACNAAKRFIVIDELYEPFLEKFSAAMSAVTFGDPMSADTVLGPLSSDTASVRLQEQLDQAIAGGARARRRRRSRKQLLPGDRAHRHHAEQ